MKTAIFAALAAFAALSGCSKAPVNATEAPVNATEPELIVPGGGVQEGGFEELNGAPDEAKETVAAPK
jgi:hypothetical protein